MRDIKKKNIKWWIGVISCMVLFSTIGVFSYMKMGFLIRGVKITATIEHSPASSVVRVNGVALNAIYLSLNGREIFIDKNGSFTEPVSLPPGLSVITLDAQDKFGKRAEKKFEVLYKEDGSEVAFNTFTSKIN